MKKQVITLLLFLSVPFISSAGLVAKYPLQNGNWLGEFNINGNMIWQVILGAIVTPAMAAELSLKEQVKNYIRAMSDVVGIDKEFMVKIGSCESWDYKEDVINNIQLGDNGKSMGVFQWQEHSWKYYDKKYGLRLDRTKWRDQVRLTTLVARDYGTASDWVNCDRYAKTGKYINKK